MYLKHKIFNLQHYFIIDMLNKENGQIYDTYHHSSLCRLSNIANCKLIENV